MSEPDFATGTAYNPLMPTLADTPVIPWADLAATNPPETPVPIGLQTVPTIAALSAQGQANPVLLQADGARRLLTSSDTDLTATTNGPVTVGDTTLPLYNALGFIVGRSILYVPLDGTHSLAGPAERHTVTNVTNNVLTLGDPILTSGALGSIVVEIPDIQVPPAGRLIAHGNTANGFINVNVPVSERFVAIGFIMGPYGDLVSLSCSGLQSGLQYVPISVTSQPGLYIFPLVGSADTTVRFGVQAISAFDTYQIIGYETVPAIYQELRGRRLGDSGNSSSFPAAGVQALRSWTPGFAFGTTVTDIIATLRNGGGVADNARLQFIPNALFPGSFFDLGQLAVTAVAGDIDRIILRDINLRIDITNGSQLQFAAAPAANNFQSIAAFTAVD